MVEIYYENPKSFIYAKSFFGASDIHDKYASKISLIYIDIMHAFSANLKLIQKAGINQGKITHENPFGKSVEKHSREKVMDEMFKISRGLLNDSGNIFIHCPVTLAAKAKAAMDKIFGSGNFVNEIIYKTNGGANSLHHFSYGHEVILFYRKARGAFFDPVPTAEARGRARRNHMKKNTAPDGRVYYSITTGGKEYRYYEDDLIHMDDVWDDIEENAENGRHRYEGERPQSLIERIIASACPKDAIVCDPFCATGITGCAAANLGRRFVLFTEGTVSANIAKNNIANYSAPFAAVWQSDEEYAARPEVRFSYKGQKVHLDDYRVQGGEKYYEQNLLPTEDTLVESWSVGHMKGGNYHVTDFDIRTAHKPTLGRYLETKKEGGNAYAMIFDAFGNRTLHKLDI